MEITLQAISYDLKEPFRTSHRLYTQADTLLVTIGDGVHRGRGEAAGLDYAGETVEIMRAQAAPVVSHVAEGKLLDRSILAEMLPPCGARNAIDCALWDLEAKRSSISAARRAGLPNPKPLRTMITLGIEEPSLTATKARNLGPGAQIKLKVGDDLDIERVEAVRKAVPGATLMLDANQAWDFARLKDLAPWCARLGIIAIEQPLSVEENDILSTYQSPVPLCADESCRDTSSIALILGRYDMINIKLDKTGGLTEALRLAELARQANLKLMVGCMEGTSLCVAPAFLIGQSCQIVDLNCSLQLTADVLGGMHLLDGELQPYETRLWG
jgi:L-alanine-DL-glutamate epimerase-like enolase superfamily enzyme